MSKNNPQEPQKGSLAMLRGLMPFLAPYRRQFVMAGIALLLSSALVYLLQPVVGSMVMAGLFLGSAATFPGGAVPSWPL